MAKPVISYYEFSYNFFPVFLLNYALTVQVTVGKRPVTGMRFYLEGMKCNR
jgi:hypothetical protein